MNQAMCLLCLKTDHLSNLVYACICNSPRHEKCIFQLIDNNFHSCSICKTQFIIETNDIIIQNIPCCIKCLIVTKDFFIRFLFASRRLLYFLVYALCLWGLVGFSYNFNNPNFDNSSLFLIFVYIIFFGLILEIIKKINSEQYIIPDFIINFHLKLYTMWLDGTFLLTIILLINVIGRFTLFLFDIGHSNIIIYWTSFSVGLIAVSLILLSIAILYILYSKLHFCCNWLNNIISKYRNLPTVTKTIVIPNPQGELFRNSYV